MNRYRGLQPLISEERYFFAFLIQAKIFMTLCSDTSLPLRTPSLPYINPAASFSFDHPFKLQQDPYSLFMSEPPSRPWLQNTPASTPLAELLSSPDSEGDTSGGHRDRRLWAGYYVVRNDETDDPVIHPPMFLELYSTKRPIDPLPFPIPEPDPSERINLQGEGYDSIGSFTLQGYCNMRTGAVTVTKAYATHEWPWRGMVTPLAPLGWRGCGVLGLTTAGGGYGRGNGVAILLRLDQTESQIISSHSKTLTPSFLHSVRHDESPLPLARVSSIASVSVCRRFGVTPSTILPY